MFSFYGIISSHCSALNRHTLVESAKLAGVDPAAYLKAAAEAALANPDTTPLLPSDMPRA